MASIVSYWKQFDAAKEAESQKNMLIEALLNDLTKSRENCEEKEKHAEQQSLLVDVIHNQLKDEKAKVKKMEQLMDCRPFVIVLVDGDSLCFQDELVRNGEQGGRKAARQLRDCVSEYISGNLDIGQSVNIVVRVYANINGVGKAYHNANILEESSNIELFVRGFNMGDPLCDFINAGIGKECSDDKIREVFRLHIENTHCKHIMFGGPTDNGYARLLGPYSENENTASRITLLEGAPFARELAELANKFKTASFQSVFRDTKLQTHTFSTTPPSSPTSLPLSYASTVSTKRPSVSSITHESEINTPYRPVVLKNSKGQRVDPLLKPVQTIVSSIKPRKLCNYYHILGGVCPWQMCSHQHGPRLTGKELEALRFIARLTPCVNGLECDDDRCVMGHRCQNHSYWRSDCRFPKEMHAVDSKIVNA
ncbi:MAG: hypothetical protein M1834_009602 [Cirrosporium novae-zelandiae]|nr:MAG: hypothetical protein M1834_009602 [Cirrosporium novae-zelandiae]